MRTVARGSAAAALLLLAWLPAASAFEWSDSEFHLQYGRIDVPTFAGGGKTTQAIYTLQHAHGWKLGDNFFFIDTKDSRGAEFQDFDFYGEWYSNFSLGKLTGTRVGAGLIEDIALVMGVNWGADAKVVKFLPGISLALDLPGFAFASLDVTAYIDDNKGAMAGGAPGESDSYMVDFAFARPFRLGEHDFSLEGHVEYIGSRRNEFGDKVPGWILAQPQLRWKVNDNLYIGIEGELWMNKLGDGATDSNAVLALLVWQF